MEHFDLIVAGGGAAGVMAAGVAAGTGKRVLLCEKMEKPQRKVRITGKGRCNLTNMRPQDEFLSKVRSSAEFFAPAFEMFSNRDTVAFFEGIGVPLAVERGERVFPSSGKAWDVAEAHVRWCRKQGAQILCRSRVTEIHTHEGHVTGATVLTPSGKPQRLSAPNVLLATGGASYPATGSTGDGYMLAYKAGHTVVEIRPSLTPLRTGAAWTASLKGLSLKNVGAALTADGRILQEEFGEMEFTPDVGGPIALRMSRRAVDALIDGRTVAIVLDLKPALGEEKLTARIAREREALPHGATLRELLLKLLPSRMVPALADLLRTPLRTPLHALSGADPLRIARTLKSVRIPIDDYGPFTEAIVTAGGVATTEVDPHTMQSRRVQGLYFAGELLDIDADTGGYNLQIAYSTGHLAGQLRGGENRTETR